MRLSLFALTLCAFLSACTVEVPNALVCADKGMLGAKCAFTRSPKEESFSKVQWDKTRVGWFCMDAKNFGKYQKFVETVCAQNKNCVDEVGAFVNNLQR